MKLVIVDDAENPTLLRAADRHPDPRRVDVFIPVGTGSVTLPGGAEIQKDISGAWLCIGQACLPPIREPEALVAILGSPNAPLT